MGMRGIVCHVLKTVKKKKKKPNTFWGFSKHFLLVNSIKKLNLYSVSKIQFIIRIVFSLLKSISPGKTYTKVRSNLNSKR